MKPKKTSEKFIEDANKIHKFKYEYLKNYTGTKSYLDIICKIHGSFSQRADHHLQGHGCNKCNIFNKITKFEDFVRQSNIIHNNKFIYNKDSYIGISHKVTIVCPIHGNFEQFGRSHLEGYDCGICSGSKKNTEIFIEEAKLLHNNKYDYFKVNYIAADKKITITCKNHGDFLQTPNSHLSAQAGCVLCSYIANRVTHEEFVNRSRKIHNNKYEYLEGYEKCDLFLKIECPIHGDFSQTPQSHMSGHGCPKCSKFISKSEIKWLNILNVPENYRQVSLKINNKRYLVDAFNPKTNTIYEFYGDFWHGNPKKFKADDINNVIKKTYGELYIKTMNKENIFKNANYKVISIWESEWKKLLKIINYP